MSKHPFEYYFPYTSVKVRRGYVNYDGRTWNRQVWRCVDCMAGVKEPCGNTACEIRDIGKSYFNGLSRAEAQSSRRIPEAAA